MTALAIALALAVFHIGMIRWGWGLRALLWLSGQRFGPRRSMLRPWRYVWPRCPAKPDWLLWMEWHLYLVRWPTESGRFEIPPDMTDEFIAELMEHFEQLEAMGDAHPDDLYPGAYRVRSLPDTGQEDQP